jgi:hypothetical protein
MKNFFEKLTISLSVLTVAVNTAHAATCTFEIPDYSQTPGSVKPLEGSELVLNMLSSGVIGPNNHKEVALQKNRTAQFNIEGFTVKNGCQKLVVSVGIKEDVSTWSTIFSNWCEGDDLIVYSATLGTLNLRCKL